MDRRSRHLQELLESDAYFARALAALSGPGAVVSSAVKKIATRVKGEGA